MSSWSLSPKSYPCSQHPQNSLTDEVRAQMGERPFPVPGGGFFDKLRKRAIAVDGGMGWNGPRKGSFSVWVACPGIEGSDKDEDKPHPELCQGDVL